MDGGDRARQLPETERAVANIRAGAASGVSAVLLANHGILLFHHTADLAVLTAGVMDEAAQAGLNAKGLGGAVLIPTDMTAAALQHAMAFERPGTASA